ncbi:uncharacterized protein CC84DRAFT_1257165 [Paraphaeosphaeria sporulosa]|uniref:Uncharacterized protein n=1 Tax=Paraphaeosphaeria sporulosa TaxID=1460663 RepID=A0A177CMU5_9PLEO|nr:uncharacterized protein CC84DRAFT_1257165 [Paraphaeosphaeria sporulosa]OAG08272.1 hypothetical protein CC84DRAFT_1257165 [Paraphaeosphaeria sporulosa]
MAKKELPPGTQKAKGMEVNISGFYGIHPIETGIAYWYRGHYLYSKAGVSVEPIPFATKKGIHIVGTTVDTAPPFHPLGVPGTRHEPEVAALHRSMAHAWEDQEKNKNEDGGTGAFEGQTGGIPGMTPSNRGANPAQCGESSNLSEGHFRLEIPKNEAESHYNDRAMFLAQSAPASHRGTPTPSQSGTPKPWGTRAASPAPLGTVASTSQMETLLEQGRVIDNLLALQKKRPDLLNPHAVNSYLSDLNKESNQEPSRPGSRATSGIALAEINPTLHQSPSRAHSRVPSGISLAGSNDTLPRSQSRHPSRVTSGISLAELNDAPLQPPDRPYSRGSGGLFLLGNKPRVTSNVSSSSASIHKDLPGPSMFDLVQGRQKSVQRTGRTRSDSMKAASLALNEAFNDFNKDSIEKGPKKTGCGILKCCVHGDNCDGVTVINEHLTLQNMKVRGLKEDYPMVANEGRTMIDWYALMNEERDAGK